MDRLGDLEPIVCALPFFHGVPLGLDAVLEQVAHARRPKTLPVVLSPEEVVRFLGAVPSLKCRTALTTAYGTGLRVSEVVALRVADIDSRRGEAAVVGRGFEGTQGILLVFCFTTLHETIHKLPMFHAHTRRHLACPKAAASAFIARLLAGWKNQPVVSRRPQRSHRGHREVIQNLFYRCSDSHSGSIILFHSPR